MGTKSNILYGKKNGLEIYIETSEPVHVYGTFQEYNTYILIPNESIEEWKIKGYYFFIDFKKQGDFLPKNIKFWGGWIIEINQDFECLCIAIKGGSIYEKALKNKDWNVFNATN
jgi:hypothetical protein